MVADRILEQLAFLEGDDGGFPISRLEHSLQTASRAEQDGRDEEYVVCALLHDIGDTLAFECAIATAGIRDRFAGKFVAHPVGDL